VLEGGYDIDALTESIAQVIEVSDRGQIDRSAAQPQAIPARQREMLRVLDERFVR
jgi:acetoin utilization deacetylase AcuC-like enzyme